MTLDKATLESSLLDLMNTHGASAADCAALWASAFGGYAADVTPSSLAPAPASAQAALETALAAAFAKKSALADMDAAFTAAAAALGAGMAPAFTATPPPAPIGWATLLAAPYPETAAAAASKIATAIDTWMKTGSAVPSAGGPAVNWS